MAAVIALAIVSPWIYREIYFLRGIEVTAISNLPDEAKLRGELTLNLWSYPYAVYAFSTGFSFGPDLDYLHRISSPASLFRDHWAALASAGAVFGALTVSGIIRARKEGTLGLFLSVSLVTTALVTIAALVNVKVFNARYLFCFFPVYIALLATGLPASGYRRVASLSAVALIMLISAWNYFMV
ncbi:MAG TPA: hypothetical protein VLA34_08685, partial [Candidatus Krumholzibacterium sp.]|nr:hypothetical protein [Candidatus Krumholzibacterium sp.]